MGPEQWLFLQWHEHKGSLISTFEKLFERNTFVDCTLAAEGQYLNVHKMILSACSPYFEILLNENRDKHPIIILKDVKFRSLKSIIEYMYRGEANVLSTEMNDFLSAAETLQIKGLGKQGGGDSRSQPAKDLRNLVEAQPLPPCEAMRTNEEKDNWADSDLSSTLTETAQESFVAQRNKTFFSQGDAGNISLPQKLPRAVAAEVEPDVEDTWLKTERLDEAADCIAASLPQLSGGSLTIEPVRPAAEPSAHRFPGPPATPGDALELEVTPKVEPAADPPAAVAGPSAPVDIEDAETASLGSSVIELSDTTEDWAEEDVASAAHDAANAFAGAADESRAPFEAVSDATRESASRDVGSEQGDPTIPIEVGVLDRMIAVMRFLVVHFQSCNKATRRPNLRPLPYLGDSLHHTSSSRVTATRTTSKSSLPWYSYLRKQIRTQSGLIFYKCEVCGYLARDFNHFVEHRRRHFSGYELHAQRTAVRKRAKNYSCPECHRSFTWLCHLKSHMRTHMGEKSLKCSECDFTARDEIELTLHQRIHTWDRQFKHTEHDVGRIQSQTSLRRSSTDVEVFCKGDDLDISTKNQLTINLVCPPQSPNDESDRQQLTDNSKSSSRQRKRREEARRPTARSGSSRNSSTRGSLATTFCSQKM